MNKSVSITKLAEALSKAQAEMPVVRMNAQNPFLKNKYADLGAVIETSRPILAKYGLSVSQFPTGTGEQIGVTSVLMHSSGEWLEDTIYISASDQKGLSVAQSAGVVISYLRRYSWASMLGMYADEDTDGHSSNGNGSSGGKAEKKIEPARAWTLQQKQAIVDAGYAENLPEALNMLNLSVLKENAGTASVTSWAKHYRGSRDEGKEIIPAAQIANEAYINATKKVTA
jgi:hypothetical protein